MTQIKTLGDALGKLSAHKKATLGVGVILSQSYCYGYHDFDCNIYLKLFFYLVLLSAYFAQILGFHNIH